jgi:hypothetical protein
MLKNQNVVYMFSFVVVLDSKTSLLHIEAFRTTWIKWIHLVEEVMNDQGDKRNVSLPLASKF